MLCHNPQARGIPTRAHVSTPLTSSGTLAALFVNSVKSHLTAFKLTETELPLMHRCLSYNCTKNENNIQFFCNAGKNSENFSNRQTTPDKQQEPPTCWNQRSEGPLTIKTNGNSAGSSPSTEFDC